MVARNYSLALVPALCILPAGILWAEETVQEIEITTADREHWSFQPIVRPELRVANATDRVRTAVDRFVLQRLEAKGLSLAPEAERATLLRRVTLDLNGLPPTLDEIAAFTADQAPDAYDRLVDRLLASPAYGERWGQHWLDLARFAETDGFEHDKVRPQAWKYRDWVIAALNADLPYDHFAALQLAGDEQELVQGLKFKVHSEDEAASTLNLKPETLNSIPTMFCLAGPDMPDVNDQVERRHHLLNEMTATVGSVFLGLQLGCAECHDHKYDPLSQADFYRLRAVFEPAVPALKRDVPCNMLKAQSDTPAARLWIRGDHRRPGPEVPPGFPRIADPAGVGAKLASASSPRGELARWLFRDDNPLTARVLANRLWQHHFGRGIFDTPSDVGLINAGPTHPELLDWLAAELRERGWSLKRLHRAILCSATYRQASRATDGDALWPKRLELDPANELYSRFPRRRLDGETLRDTMLAAGELLSTERGGPGVMAPLPKELLGTLLKGQWSVSPREADHYRRSIYLFARRNLRYPLFEAFDRPDGNASCPLRSRSTTAPQSLVLLNSEFSLLAARQLAGSIAAATDDAPRQIEQLYLRVLSRTPTEQESRQLAAFLETQRTQLVDKKRERHDLALPVGYSKEDDPYAGAALVDACLALLNSNEFLYID